MKNPVLHMKVARGSSHPWIFTKMVSHPAARPRPGAVVDVVSKEGDFLGRVFYHPSQTIAVRVLTTDPAEAIDRAFFERKLSAAADLRLRTLRLGESTDSWRLAHAEADGLSGIVVDRFADLFVVEPFCAGGATAGRDIAAALSSLFPGCSVAFRVSPRTADREGADFSGLLSEFRPPKSVDVNEHGIRMRVDFSSVHKTGYFLDQRENRVEAGRMAAGRNVFDLFCYTGGFSMHAAAAGAASVTAVDLDEKAIAMARVNAKLNGLSGNISFVHQDAFDFLRARVSAGEKADMVVVDPAKLAAVKDEIPRALKTYGDVNRLAMQAVKPGGVLLTCSCSGLVSEEKFRSVVSRSAEEAGVELQIFRVTGASPDHPVSSVFPEGRYLKAIWARVV